MKKTKGVILFSGGLDSVLAARLLMEQNIELIGFHCILPFSDPHIKNEDLAVTKSAKQIGLKLVYHKCGKEYLDMVKNPPNGYGKYVNPCIDCKIYFITKAAEYMNEIGADFVATGEVVGQRPMSQQKHTINQIKNETKLDGRLLRPLSAKILKPTFVEEQGLVNRDKLLDFNGRGRTRQMKLAEKYGIENYESPSGGCHFTEELVANKARDLFKYHFDYSSDDIFLLSGGRHFRISETTKVIVGRNEFENENIEKLKYIGTLFRPNFKGATLLVKGLIEEKDYEFVSSILARYGKPEELEYEVEIEKPSGEKVMKKFHKIITDEELNEIRI